MAAIAAVAEATEVPTPIGQRRAGMACRQFRQARVAEAVDMAVVVVDTVVVDITDTPIRRLA
jgi:hypothetical protein